MTTCLKTGARVYFQEYGFVVPADIYSVGNCYIIRWNNAGKEYVHHVEPHYSIANVGHAGFHRDDLGVTVIPQTQYRWPSEE